MPIHQFIIRAILLSIIVVGQMSISAAEKGHSLEALVKLPEVSNIQISPDGKHFSVVFREGLKQKLAIFETETRKPKSVFHVRGLRRSVGEVNWVSNQRLVYGINQSYYYDKALRNTGELMGVNIDGSEHDMLFGINIYNKQTGSRIKKKQADKGGHEIIDLLEDDDKHILIAFYPWSLQGNVWRSNHNAIPSVYKLNIYSGKKKFVTKLNLPNAVAITDLNSQVRFAVGLNNSNRSVISYRDNQDEDWKEFDLSGFPGTNVYPLSFAGDNKSVYVSATIDGGTRGLFRVNLADNTFVKEFHDPKVNMTLHSRDFSGREIIIVGTELGLPKYEYIKPKARKAKLHKSLIAAFKDHDIRITSSTKDGKWNVVYVYSSQNSGDYYLFNSEDMSAQHLFSASAWLDPSLLAEMNPITIKTRDNINLYGYLTLPKNAKNNLPMVVLPHGGPHGIRDFWDYDWRVQLLANEGYAVLQINFRGSGGFGSQFGEAGYGKWGTLMQDDLTDATLAMIEKGVADKERICIYGASYGGYAALMGAVREPELYKCAIGSMGVYDLPMMFERGDIITRQSGLAYLKEAVGTDIADQKNRSPVYNAEKIKANVMLIHGAQDERAPIEQAEALKDAFDKIGKKYEWLELDDESHGYYDENNRLLVYTKILEFLEANIGK